MQETASLIVAGWAFGAPPSGWEVVPGAGLRRAEPGRFPSNAALVVEELPAATTLHAYVERQLATIRLRLTDGLVTGPVPASLGGAEAADVRIEHAVEGGTRVLQRQLYARHEGRVTVLTFTTIAADTREVEGAFDAIARGLHRVA